MDASEEAITSQMNWWGGRYSVEQEHHIEVISILIGSTFVLGQTAITQTVSIAKWIYDLAGKPEWLHGDKGSVMQTEATLHLKTNLSEVVLIDAVANYFKHHSEWPDDWTPTRSSKRTIDLVRELGLSPETNLDDNLRTALYELDLTAPRPSLGSRIQKWRERLADNLRRKLQNHNVV